MPTTRTTTDFAARIMQIGMAAQKSQKDAVFRASMLVKQEIEKELTRAIGGDHVMSNLRNKSGFKRFSVGFNIKGTTNPTSLIRARGPWGLVENGAKPHSIPKRGQLARRSRLGRGGFSDRKAMPINGNFRYVVRNHPGTRGKQPFRKGLDRATPRAIKVLHTTVHSAVVDVIRSGRDSYTYIRGVGAH